ncbi:unnamed protein product [Phyllotreta striolata]|uniref:Glycoside hydrolase family 28 n=1 Tax=Phyllotreta striolata TaxID=444603 RepID=A0A9N9XJ56_PHYSR|nr:unnamed protein product [Phyllotreta striolata]
MLIKILLTFGAIITANAKPPEIASANITSSCVITEYNQVENVVKACTNIVIQNLAVPANKKLVINLREGSVLTFRGTTSFGVGSLNDWLLTISGTNIHVIGEKGSLIHGHGEQYWDGQGGGGGRIKPKLLQISHVTNAKFENINLKNCPMFCTGVTNAEGLTIDGWRADCSEGDKGGGRNTDGIGISWSNNVNINDAFIHNQDQCLYVNQGTNMVFTKIHCVNSNGICATAGFSKTSYEENTVKNISFRNCVMEGGLTGVQIIAMSSGGNGEITDVSFHNVVLKGVRQQGIYIQMDYGNTGHVNNNIAVNNFQVSEIHGTVERNAEAVHIICGAKCNQLRFSDIKITGSKVRNQCNVQPTGFKCL